ncbi:MAG: cytochrome-c oxidase [Alphaproteobacteria bacterium CG_4_10_14_0_2_um_filter_63_37]|nr:MAG: cytochrome-c oxidase [Alphaproteobacteria bacterium CG_4_10_14_0_2_um_filter_63_37]
MSTTQFKPGTASKVWFFSSIVWFCIGTGMGSIVAAKLAWPDFLHGSYWMAFGHLRPMHVMTVIFGWITMAFGAAMLYMTPALCNCELWSEKLGVVNAWLFNVGLALADFTLFLGYTSGREYSDFIWPIDLYIAVFMVIPLAVNIWMTVLNRNTQGIYATVWFFATCLWLLIVVFLIGQSPELFHLTGLNEAYFTWWFAHNVLGLWITPVAAAIAYYIVPKVTGNALYSHRIAHLHFWSIVAFYSTPAAHHLMGAPLPEWLKSFASVEGVLILVPAIAFAANLLLTMQGKWRMFVDNLTIKFVVTGVILAIPLNFQGGFQQTRAINWYIHGTHWIVGHAHLALLGMSTFIEAGGAYYGMQKILGKRLYSASLGELHYWLTLIGFVIYWTAVTAAGLIQGAGKIYEVPYIDTVAAAHPYMVARWVGGTMVFVGQLVWLYNMVMTAKAGAPLREGELEAGNAHAAA